MDIRKLAESLHPFERKVLPLVEERQTVRNIADACSLQEVEVMRALQWLENKGAVELSAEESELVDLDSNGKLYADKGLPERRFLDAISEDTLSVSQLEKKGLGKDEINACVGLLRRKGAVDLMKDGELSFTITDRGRELLEKPFLEESFLELDFPRDISSLSDEERFALESLKKRKGMVVVGKHKTKRAVLTDLGRDLISSAVREQDIVDVVSPALLRSGDWQGKSFRRFDVRINVPKVFGGKLQPYRVFLDWVRSRLVALGFEEMPGPLVESDFWDMDALFMPQFHSARDIHDAYYIEDATASDIPGKLLKKVKAAHESGGDTGSSGWKYHFDVGRTKQMLLRTQTTACSARKLASAPAVPGKYFAVARCFRYDVVDATHLPDFNQTEGFIIGEDLNFRHLVGLLKMFAREFADAEDVKVVPGYFPFTEPSAELFAKHPKLGWIELGGAGIFRPEVVKPLLGEYRPVLAWGLGIDRIAMLKLGIDDIRDLFSHDLQFLRDARLV